MNTKNFAAGVIFLVTVVLLAALPFGCKEKEPLPADVNEHLGHDHNEALAAADAEQKKCPIMTTMPINKAVFIEYQGKKVYFCCESCKDVFQKEPEKYLAGLPQFKK